MGFTRKLCFVKVTNTAIGTRIQTFEVAQQKLFSFDNNKQGKKRKEKVDSRFLLDDVSSCCH